MKKKLKSCMSILLCFIVLCSTSSLVYAIEETGGNDAVSVISQDEDFFIIGGVLKTYMGDDTVVVIPDGVIGIDESAFTECDEIEEIVIPGSVKCIDRINFHYNTNIKKITLLEGVEEIGDLAFFACDL